MRPLEIIAVGLGLGTVALLSVLFFLAEYIGDREKRRDAEKRDN